MLETKIPVKVVILVGGPQRGNNFLIDFSVDCKFL